MLQPKLRAAIAMAGLAITATLQACTCQNESCSDQPEDDQNPCTVDLCVNGITVHEPLPDKNTCFTGTAAGACQGGICRTPCGAATKHTDCDDRNFCTTDDCQQGACIHASIHGDLPNVDEDGNPCTWTTCADGTLYNLPHPDGTACGSGGECRAGICSKCENVTHCGKSTACVTWACAYGACEVTYKPAGEPVPGYAQLQGDCRKLLCDGYGGVEADADENDKPIEDGNECTEEICIGWTPVHAPYPAETPCLMGQAVCDGQGSCVECTKDDHCGPGAKVCFQEQCFDCADGVQNGNETGIDCGGSCPACLGDPCNAGSECKSGYCIDGVCCGSLCGTCFTCNSAGNAGQCKVVPKEEEDPPGCLSAAGKACNGFGACKTAVGYSCMYDIECASNQCMGGTCWPTP